LHGKFQNVFRVQYAQTPTPEDGRGKQWQLQGDTSTPAIPRIKYVIYLGDFAPRRWWLSYICHQIPMPNCIVIFYKRIIGLHEYNFTPDTLLSKLYKDVIVKLTTLTATSYRTKEIWIQIDISWRGWTKVPQQGPEFWMNWGLRNFAPQTDNFS